MILLFDIGNTHTHLGLANARRVVRQVDIPTAAWFEGRRGAGEKICRAPTDRGGDVQRGPEGHTTGPSRRRENWRRLN